MVFIPLLRVLWRGREKLEGIYVVGLNIDHVLLEGFKDTREEDRSRSFSRFISLHPLLLIDLGLQPGFHLLEAQQVVDRVVDRVSRFIRVTDRLGRFLRIIDRMILLVRVIHGLIRLGLILRLIRVLRWVGRLRAGLGREGGVGGEGECLGGVC